jgi:hypothetical protein
LEELEFLGLVNFREWSGPSRGGIWHFWKFLPLHFPTPEEQGNLRIWRTFRGFEGIFED